MDVHLVDGTYELFRQHFGRPGPGPYGATVGVLGSTLGLFEGGATHVGVASDHIIESFRNDLWPGYKTSAGMPPELLAQLPVFEDALEAMGVTVWPMIEYEADDAMAAAAAIADADDRVGQVFLCTPDKDLGQCVVGTRVVQLDRRKGLLIDEDGVRAKFGVGPESIPDYLALVGDSADGFPGLPGFGAKTAAAVLAKYPHLEDIPRHGAQWDVPGLRHVPRLADTLVESFELALLFRRIATVERDVEVGTVDDWRWTGPTERFASVCERLGSKSLHGRALRAAKGRR
ncbi:MAG TPA: 5'-3' exonuclease H3TH domain-containing protein [Acidimicrobiales bacterium]|nr:5'-3' exonuclease H3TH domain-containing protein [Acidimicrobiales bacterium]